MFKEIFAYSNLLMMRAQNAGNLALDGHHPSPEEEEIQIEAAKTANHIANLLKTCKAEDIPLLAECYDNLYRIGYREAPDRTYMDSLYQRVFEAWQSGNRNIEESAIFAMIAPRITNPRALVPADQAQAYREILHRWLDTLNRYNRFPTATTHENYLRLSLLPQHRIKRYYPNPAEVRRHWYESNKVENPHELRITLLRAYRTFILSLEYDVLSPEERTAIDNEILSALTLRPANIFERRDA